MENKTKTFKQYLKEGKDTLIKKTDNLEVIISKIDVEMNSLTERLEKIQPINNFSKLIDFQNKPSTDITVVETAEIQAQLKDLSTMRRLANELLMLISGYKSRDNYTVD